MTALVQTIFKIYTADGHFVVEAHPEFLEAVEPIVRLRFFEIGSETCDAEIIIDYDSLADLSKILAYYAQKGKET